jgi:pimeloyl-ACP methyl ester carboxylesterase
MACHAPRVTVRLHHEQLVAAGATPARWLLMTHGIFGTGGNWRSIARKIIERRPTWGAVLVDLRGHGRSDQGTAPHTIEACAADVRALIDDLATRGARIEVASGHSFGGKVMLALRASGAPLAQTWVLDSTPSPRPELWNRTDNDVRLVWEALHELPRDWPQRDAFVAALTGRGFSTTLSQWLAQSLMPVPGGGGLRLRFELDAIHAMLQSYGAIDLWPAVEDPSLAGETHHVVADRSDTVSPADRARLAGEPPERRAHYHLVKDAGHWLHVEAPAAIIELVSGALPA